MLFSALVSPSLGLAASTPQRSPAAPVVPVLTNPRNSKQILIQPGDSLWKLARRHLGNGSRWNDLLASNSSISDPLRLQSGAVLVVPGTDLRSRMQPSRVTIQAATLSGKSPLRNSAAAPPGPASPKPIPNCAALISFTRANS